MRRLLPLLLLLGGFAAAPDDERPNLLFCIADDWSYPHAGVYGDPAARTPTFDRVASEGLLFTNAYCASPSCTPSRAAVLTGQAIHRLEDTGNLWSRFPAKFERYPDLLERAGYVVGLQGKGWGPGDFKAGGLSRNPAGPPFRSFDAFLKSVPAGKPFCFWFGSKDPHRPYVADTGAGGGFKLDAIRVPPGLPDSPAVRGDLADYLFAVQRFDRDVAEMLKLLEDGGRAKNTIVVMTSDNGMPFPRAKANLYDAGTRMPLAIRWPARVKGGRRTEAFASHCDFAPTFLEAAGLPVPAEMTGHSLLPLLLSDDAAGRDRVFFGRERHANVREGDLSYPARAIRTAEWLLIRNLRPEAWPAGDPKKWKAVGDFGDCDGGPSKEHVLAHRDEGSFFKLAFEKRPAVELFEIARDPAQLTNVAAQHPDVVAKLEAALIEWLTKTGDPRVSGAALSGEDPRWDKYPYFGN